MTEHHFLRKVDQWSHSGKTFVVSTNANDLELDYAKAFGICTSLHSRLDTLWQRILYVHAAIVGVMVYFAGTPDPNLMPRLLVFAFYSVNLAITVTAMQESYLGLIAAIADLKTARGDRKSGQLEQWLTSLDYKAQPRRRFMVLAVIWILVGYLLLGRFVF